jgi:hypothetical protein
MIWMSTLWLGDCSLNAKAIPFHANSKKVVRNAAALGYLRKHQILTPKGEPLIIAAIPVLDGTVYPAAIFRLIAAIIIAPIDGKPLLKAVGLSPRAKGSKVLPFVAHPNASRTISVKVDTVLFRASGLHILPDCIELGVRTAVSSTMPHACLLPVRTGSALRRIANPKRIWHDVALRAAVTYASAH